jgi:peptidoglycan/LPS O-acetylase OafA/YrhL
MANHAAGRRPRFEGIDALRGLAALAVSLYHFTMMYEVYHGFPGSKPVLVAGGIEAVYLFFTISGFVILLSAEHFDRAESFLRARFFRLFPAYWFCVAVTFVALRVVGLPGHEVSVLEFAANLTMLQGFMGIDNLDGVYWSLQVELCFYGYVAVMMVFRLMKYFPFLLLALMVVGVVWQIAEPPPETPLLDSRPHSIRNVEVLLLARTIHFFAAGTAIHLLHSGRIRTGRMLILAAIAHSLITLTTRQAAAAIVIFAVVGLVVRYQPAFLANPYLLFLGAISYSFYLIHDNIGNMIMMHTLRAGLGPYPAIGIALASTLAMATVVTFCIEKPILKWSRRAKAKNDSSTPIASVGRALPATISNTASLPAVRGLEINH